MLLIVGAVPGCASLRQTAAEVTIRQPGDRLLGAPQPVQPEARKDMEFAWLAEAAYGKTQAGRQAFDPSPVTGFFSVDPDTRDMNRRTLAIDRIYERGEILAIVRSLTSLFVAPSASQPTIRGVRYALFYPADPITGHPMTEFACRMYGAAGIGP